MHPMRKRTLLKIFSYFYTGQYKCPVRLYFEALQHPFTTLMKHSLRFFSLLLLVIAGSLSSAFAQTSTRFAYVNKERNLIYIHEGEQRDTLFLPNAAQKFGASRL